MARESRECLKPHLGRGRKIGIQVFEEDHPGETVPVPGSALPLIYGILNEMAEGNTVTVMNATSELTTQQAADLLNVSRPHLIDLLESGRIPFHRVGTHRRVRLQDALAYRQAVRERRLKALQELAEQAQELDMGY
jgi:excisionase family DNA binding protein